MGVAVVVLLVVAVVLIWGRLAQFNERTSTAVSVSSALFGPLTWGDQPVNVLILGYGGPQHEGPYLTDSMNLLSIDPSRDITTMIPIPRDLWIEGMPSMPVNGKINTAFSAGHARGGVVEGAEVAASVVEAVTGLDVEHWVTIDFDGFKAVVDAIGGVTIDNPTAFSYGSPEAHAAGTGWDATFPAGTLELDGDAALFYARTRYTSEPAESTDFARSERQQRVLQAVMSKIAGAGMGSIGAGLDAMDAVQENLYTNLSVLDLGLIAGRIAPDRRVELSEDVILEATTTTDGQYVLVPIGRTGPSDYQPLRRFVEQRLGQPIAEPSPSPGR